MDDRSLGFNYLGLIDDVVQRYPWRFDVTRNSLNATLATQVIDGRPIILNDGYLVNHPVAREALMDQKSLLWHLINVGFVRVMTRGGNDYSLAEMPLRMSKDILSFDDLVHDRVKGVAWRELRPVLEETDKDLRRKGHLMDWPPYDAGSGFAVLAERLQTRRASTRSLGMGRYVSNGLFRNFLAEFLERMGRDTSGARNLWEALAEKYARQTPDTMPREAFKRSLMRLANEMYHYNMGLMLSAHHQTTVSVETQTSAAFDDLLISQDIFLDELNAYPRLRVPAAVGVAHPVLIAHIVDPASKLFKLRADWMAHRARWETDHRSLWDRGSSAVSAAIASDTKAAGEAYARALTDHFKNDVKFDKAEGLFNLAVGALLKQPAAYATAGLGTGAATMWFTGDPQAAAWAGIATSFVISAAQKRFLGSVTKKFRVFMLENQLVPDGLIQRSQRMVEKIKARKVPSAIDIDPAVATDLTRRMKPFRLAGSTGPINA